MSKRILFLVTLIGVFIFSDRANAQMDIVNNQSAEDLVEILTGEGVVVLNPVLNCPGLANGKFEITGGHTLGIDTGIILTSGRAATDGFNMGANGPNTNSGPAFTSGGLNFDADLSTVLPIANPSIRDVCYLEFDFLPAGDSISFDYVFASSEYWGYSCSNFNDVFGFFISGPGIIGTQNIAVVPGTNIPVTVNSTTGVGTGTQCTEMGPGSPFAQFYNDNTGGATITYGGFTDVFTAQAQVNPCDTYHLKLAIADLHDSNLDSGVFLKAGSLTSASMDISTVGGGGLEYPNTGTVRGCAPAIVTVSRGETTIAMDLDVNIMYGGSAINGIDYVNLPTTVTIPAGNLSTEIEVHGIPIMPAQGVKDLIIQILSPFNCANNEPIVLAADTIYIYDSLQVALNLTDSAICVGESVELIIQDASEQFTYTWLPDDNTIEVAADGLSAIVTPTGPTQYKVMANLDLLGSCGQSEAVVNIDVKVTPQIDLPARIYSCGMVPMELPLQTSPNNSDEWYTWSPAGSLNDPTLKNPIANPDVTTEYEVVVNPGAEGCNAHGIITVEVLPDFITINTPDQVVCEGTMIEFEVNGHEEFSYNWNPDQDFMNHTEKNGRLLARNSGYYVLTASYPNCNSMNDSVYIEVQPTPIVNVGEDHVICSYDSIHLFGEVYPHNYEHYSFEWTPSAGLSDPFIKDPIFKHYEGGKYILNVTTPQGCVGKDSLQIVVNAGSFLNVMETHIDLCANEEIQLQADGAYQYQWSPSDGLSASNISNPIAMPHSTTTYKVVGKSEDNCYDSIDVLVAIHPEAIVYLEDSITIYPGEEYWINPETNALYFEWFPYSGLSDQHISNPITSPEASTRYFITATTEYGCSVIDSIDVIVMDESVFNLPNAFNPKSNHTFKVERRGNVTLESFTIYNRWGQEVFSTTNIDEGWDGKHKDIMQPLGVYIYIVEGVTNLGKRVKVEGNVTLIH